jgi:predicted enzyme related to lactoylglutathione lyase
MVDIEFTYAHAAILVSNLERSARFYERAFGWQQEFTREFGEILGEANGYGVPGRTMMGKLGGVPLQLVEMEVELERKERPRHYGIFMCSVMVEQLEPVRERLRAADVPITREVDIGTVRLLVITDPDGQEIGIMAVRP